MSGKNVSTAGFKPTTLNSKVEHATITPWRPHIYSGGKNKWDKTFHEIGKSAVAL